MIKNLKRTIANGVAFGLYLPGIELFLDFALHEPCCNERQMLFERLDLLREDDRAVFGDKGYVNNDLKRHARKAGVFWGVSLKGSKTRPLGEANKRFNHKMSSIRARVEHVFRVIKRQFGYTKVRYKGIAKNAAQVFSLIGLTNLYLARGTLMN